MFEKNLRVESGRVKRCLKPRSPYWVGPEAGAFQSHASGRGHLEPTRPARSGSTREKSGFFPFFPNPTEVGNRKHPICVLPRLMSRVNQNYRKRATSMVANRFPTPNGVASRQNPSPFIRDRGLAPLLAGFLFIVCPVGVCKQYVSA